MTGFGALSRALVAAGWLAAASVFAPSWAQGSPPELMPMPEDPPFGEEQPFSEPVPVPEDIPPTEDDQTPGAGVELDPAMEAEALLDRLAEAPSEVEAEAIEQQVIQAWHRSGSDTVDLLLRRSIDAIQEKDYALALEYLDTIVTLAPDFPEGWNKRASVYYMIDEYGRSIADLGRVLSLQPRHFGALTGLGMIFGEFEDSERALEAFQKALEANPYLEEAREKVEELSLEVEGRGI